jgi:predicted acylesterase/phospholipase RssA
MKHRKPGLAPGFFGAGAVAGLTRSGSRPDFAVVTGVSAGALVAPFAFLGPDGYRAGS